MQRTTRLRLLPLLRRTAPARRFTTTSARHSDSPFNSGPAPPRLPKEEQEIFERLQRQSTGAFSIPRSSDSASSASPASVATSPSRPQINQSPDSSSSSSSPSTLEEPQAPRIVDGQEVHPNMRRGAPPEFEGDVNPKTGEVGGPKNEPLRWGSRGDWSFNGRVTDF